MSAPDQRVTAPPGPKRPAIEPGMRLGKYVLRYLIGRGGMAEVWAADEQGPDGYQNPVAIKLTLDSVLSESEAMTLFLQEAKTATALRHGNLVSTFSFDRAGPDAHSALRGRHYIVMERVEGADLARLMEALARQSHSCPQKIAAFIAGEVLKGLAYVHGRKDTNSLDMRLVHRDVSPHNVLVTYSGEVKLSDFGIAKSMRSKHTGTIRGKFAYFAPEILNGHQPSPYSDQFAVGIVLWELLAGRSLFENDDETQVLAAVLRCEIPPVGREIDPSLDALVRRMLSKEPHLRFPSAAAAAEAVFALPGYRPSGAPLGKLLASLLPDRDKRWTPEVEARDLLAEMSGPVKTVDYPQAIDPSPAVAIDLDTNEMVPVSACFAGKAPFDRLTEEDWASWWRARGIVRDAEIYGGAAEAAQTQAVRRPPRP